MGWVALAGPRVVGAWLGLGVVPVCLLAQAQPRPTYRSSIDVVAVTAVVHDQKGRPVHDLSRADFAVLDTGRERPIVEFRADRSGPLSLSIVLDTSGSMRVSRKWDLALETVRQLTAALDPARDDAALFAFDSGLREIRYFADDVGSIVSAAGALEPFGPTALYDAMAAAAGRFAGQGPGRRAMIVVTDGIDTSSRLTPERAWNIASTVDAPAYIVFVRSPIDEGSDEAARVQDLVRWTGGRTFSVSTAPEAAATTRGLTEELRHRYVIGFESAGEPGWHPLEIRMRDRKLVVRTRSGYLTD